MLQSEIAETLPETDVVEPYGWSVFTIEPRGLGSRQDRIHFCRTERTILSIVAVPGVNTKYPDAFVLRRLDALALADVLEDRIICAARAPTSKRTRGRSAIFNAGVDVLVETTNAEMVVLGLCSPDGRPTVEVAIDFKKAVRLVYWLRDQFAQSSLELATKDGRHLALCDAIGWHEGTSL